MRDRHRVFLHMAVVKFGIALGIVALIVSEIDPAKKGLSLHLTGWHGYWFLGGVLAITLPVGALVAYLVGLKNGSRVK